MKNTIDQILNQEAKVWKAKAPSNIALIKYWGKKANQLPCNPSLSYTLNESFTESELRIFPRGSRSWIEVLFEGESKSSFVPKIEKWVDSFVSEYSYLADISLQFNSKNTFPHSAGIASSASAFATMAHLILQLENELTGQGVDDKLWSSLARLGSGSACRSISGPLMLWGHIPSIENSSDEYACEWNLVHQDFRSMGDAILIISDKEKAVSSSVGHGLMNNHPYAETRFKQANKNLIELLGAMKLNDWNLFSQVVEEEALSLHGLMMNSRPSYTLMRPNTLSAIEEIKKAQNNGLPITFTLDAGPNVHLLYPLKHRGAVLEFIESKLVHLCSNGQWINDSSGVYNG
jgi:diphosphomevalonate decarboxylase